MIIHRNILSVNTTRVAFRLAAGFFLISIGLFLLNLINTINEYRIDQSFSAKLRREDILENIKAQEVIRERFLQKRDDLIGSKEISLRSPWDVATGIYFWDYFPPTFNCPFLLERIGRPGDGGKWVCGFELLEKQVKTTPCVVYSFGVGPDSSFETEVLDRTQCTIYAYDYSVETTKINTNLYPENRVKFFKLGLGDRQRLKPPVKTLGDFMRDNGHEWIDLLKVDVEGAEYDAFDQILNEFEVLPFSHLNLEVHIKDFDIKNQKVEDGAQLKKYFDWWTRLEDKGLRAYTWEVNHHPCSILKRKPIAHEYSFINIKNLESSKENFYSPFHI